MDFRLDSDERAELDAKLKEGLVAMEHFTRRFMDHLGADHHEPIAGVLDVKAHKDHPEVLKKGHMLVFDPSVYPQVEEQNAELLTPASPFFRKMMGLAESIGPTGLVQTRRATPFTMFHFHVLLEGMNYEWESLVTIAVDDDGDPVKDPPSVRMLVESLSEVPEEERTGAMEQEAAAGRHVFEPVDPAAVTVERRQVPPQALDVAPRMLKQQIAGKLDELAGAVETGLRKTQERLHAYYEQMRDEIRREEIKLRRKIGELNSKIWYLEDKIKLMRLEKEREVLSKELGKVKDKTQRALEHLKLEEEERMAKEAERARPSVRIRLAAATRVLVK